MKKPAMTDPGQTVRFAEAAERYYKEITDLVPSIYSDDFLTLPPDAQRVGVICLAVQSLFTSSIQPEEVNPGPTLKGLGLAIGGLLIQMPPDARLAAALTLNMSISKALEDAGIIGS